MCLQKVHLCVQNEQWQRYILKFGASAVTGSQSEVDCSNLLSHGRQLFSIGW